MWTGRTARWIAWEIFLDPEIGERGAGHRPRELVEPAGVRLEPSDGDEELVQLVPGEAAGGRDPQFGEIKGRPDPQLEVGGGERLRARGQVDRDQELSGSQMVAQGPVPDRS